MEAISDTTLVPQVDLHLTRELFYAGRTRDGRTLLEMVEEIELAVHFLGRAVDEPLSTSFPHLHTKISSSLSNPMYESGFSDDLWSSANMAECNTVAEW